MSEVNKAIEAFTQDELWAIEKKARAFQNTSLGAHWKRVYQNLELAANHLRAKLALTEKGYEKAAEEKLDGS